MPFRRLTTAMALKLDPTRSTMMRDHRADEAAFAESTKGGFRVYVQMQTGESQTVLLLQIGRDLSVRPAKELVDDLETLLGHGSGSTQRRRVASAQASWSKRSCSPMHRRMPNRPPLKRLPKRVTRRVAYCCKSRPMRIDE